MSRTTDATVLHVDMDAFYVAVELRDQPELAERPVAVGGQGRGVVLSASYRARQHGLRSGMPMSRARRLCPGLVVIPPRFDHYAAVSAGVMEIFRSITPVMRPYSLDEAFLDVAGAHRRLGSPRAVAQLIRDRVADEQQITCSIGVANSLLVAKMASNACKPDGLLVVPPADVVPFLHPRPVQAIWGVGEATASRLQRFGLHTVGDLAAVPATTLVRAFGPGVGTQLAAYAWGQDDRQVGVDPAVHERSVGSQQTLAHDVDDPVQMRRVLLGLASRVAPRLRRAGLAGRTVTLTVRFADFTTITRSRSLRDPTDVTDEIYAAATSMLDALALQRARVRLLGVRVSATLPAEQAHRQLMLDQRERGWAEAERAVDAAVARFGRGVVRRAALVPDRDP